MGSMQPKLQTQRPHLDGRHEGEVANEDDAQLCGHVLHDGPALAAQAWWGGGDNNRATGQHVTSVRCMWAHDRMAHMRQLPTKVPLRTLLRVQLYREGGPGGPEESSDHLRKLGEVGC